MSERPTTLITGGLGFLATWLTARLLDRDHDVVLVDNRDPQASPAALSGLLDNPRVSTVHADITRRGSLDGLSAVDNVVHAAAVLGVRTVREAPAETLRVNVDGTGAMLDYAVRVRGLRRFVLLSTSEVYGSQDHSASEDEWLAVRTDDPRWSYAVSKVTGEAMTAACGVRHGLRYTIVRPFNVYGPLRSGGYAVGALAGQAVAGQPLTVHGDGAQSRAWCHVADFADGLAACVDSPAAIDETFNIGDDRFVLTVADLAERIRALAGGTAPVVRVPRTGPDIQARRPSLTKARRLLGYRPSQDLSAGLAETIEWIRAGSGAFRLGLRGVVATGGAS